MRFFLNSSIFHLYSYLLPSPRNIFGILLILIKISGCSSNKYSAQKQNITTSTKSNKLIDQQKIPESEFKKIIYKESGIASYYGGKDGLHRKKTASGQRFDKNSLTAAHPSLPFLSVVRVTNLENNKKVIVTINDRGPFVKNRIIDLSEKAAKILDMKIKGYAKVMVEYLGDAAKKISIKPKASIQRANK